MRLVKPASSPRPPSGAVVPVAFVAACAVWLGLAAMPRAVPPPPPPPVVIAPRAAAEQQALDRREMTRVPRDPRVASADDAFRRYGTTTLAPGGDQLASQAQDDFRRALAAIEQSHGRRALRALRARHAWALVDVMADASERGRALRVELGGDLIATLTRGGLLALPATPGAPPELRAPLAAVAVFAKARWNVVAGDDRGRELSPFELFVFHGFRATRFEGVRIASRLQALQELTPFAGEYPVRLALGGLRYQGADYDGAVVDFVEALGDGMSFRVRNYLRAAAERSSP